MNTNKDITILLSGFLTSLLFFLTTIGVSFDWFTIESIDAFVVFIGAVIALGVNGYAIWKNTYVSRKAQIQKKVLEQRGLK